MYFGFWRIRYCHLQQHWWTYRLSVCCCSVTQWCLTLCCPLNSSTPGFRLPCPSPSPGAFSNSCPSSQWCHPTISSSVVPVSSCTQSFPASGSFPVSQLFASGGQSIGASALASVLPILGINSLSVGLFTNTLFHSAACLCVLFMVSFAVQNLLSLIGSPRLVLFFFPWDTGPRKYCYDICQRTFCLCSLPGVLWGPVLNLGL